MFIPDHVLKLVKLLDKYQATGACLGFSHDEVNSILAYYVDKSLASLTFSLDDAIFSARDELIRTAKINS